MKKTILVLLMILICNPTNGAVVSGSWTGGSVNPGAPVFVRTQGLQTNTSELDTFQTLSVSGQYATDRASLISHATTARDSWPYTITAGAWDGPGGACEPVGTTGVGNQYDLHYMASDIFAMALAGYLASDDTMFAAVKTRLVELQAITDFEATDLSGGNQCILDLGSAAYHLTEAAWLLEEAGYSSWSVTDRYALASWLVREVFPLVDWAIDNRKNNWGIVGLGSALAISAYANGGVSVMLDGTGAAVTPAAYLNAYMTPLAKWMSFNTGDQLDSACHPTYDFGFQASGAFPDDLRRPSSVGSADCEAASIAAHSTDGGCSSATSCDQNGGHFYSQKSTNALVRVAEIRRRLGDTAVFEMDTHAGGDVDIIAAAKFTSGPSYQTWLIQDTTQGYRYVAGEYYQDAALLAALQSGPSVSVRGGRDYAYTRITHAPGVAYPLPEENFTSLAESSLFGNGGAIFDATTRVVPKVYHGPPPSNASYANTVTMTDSCSSDATTQNTLANLISESHANNVSDNTVIVLPPSCRINLFMTPGYDDTVVLTLANKYDNVKLYCANRTTCGFRNNFSSPRDETLNNRATSLQIGASGITGTNQSYSLTATSYVWGSKVVQSASAIDVTDTGDGLAWGPGDIVEIRLGRITGYGSNTPDWMTRITCIRDNSGNLYGSDCTQISGNNQFQLADVPPLNLHPNAYFWGNEGLGSAFTPHSSEGGNLSGTYAATSGHEIHQVERMGTTRCGVVGDGSVCGRGTETNNVPENIWLENISFTVADNVLGTRYLIGANWYGGGAYKVQVDRTVGRVSAFTFGNRSNGWRVSHLSLHSMAWTGTGANVKCIGKILAVNATDPVTVDVQTYISPAPYNRVECDSVRSIADNADANPDSSNDPNWSEPEIQFSWDVADSRLAGKRFRVTSSYIGGSPTANRVTLTGLNASSLSPALNTTVAGYAANIDRYGGASFYLNDSSSYVQVVNSWFENTAQHAIMQGCAGCAYVHNFVTSLGDEAEGGRGPFFHGNRGESGNTFDGNDQTQAMILIDSGNGEPAGHGEGSNNAYCLNRKRANPALSWPLGSAVGQDYASDASFALLATGQNGAAQDDWVFMLNSSQTNLWSGTIDNCDNDDNDPSGTGDSTCVTASRQPNEPPAGQLFQPAAYRNRCATCNQDSNFRTATGSPQWGTPFTDVRAFEYGDSSPAPVAPFTDERSGAPQSCFLTETPEYWCAESGFVGQMGANWDDWNNPSTIKEIPAHIAYKIARGFGGTCTPVN